MWQVTENNQGRVVVSFENDGGGFEIIIIDGIEKSIIDLYEIPPYGGEPRYDSTHRTFKAALTQANTFT